MKVEVDKEKCCGAGQCVMIAPDVFDQGDGDGVVILLRDTPAPEHRDGVREAVAVCPAAAIAIVG
ncbi:MAG: ferredoxin [Sphaerisporangium sp.]|nr:ferredoxin [Sphaerisporangium sp.]